MVHSQGVGGAPVPLNQEHGSLAICEDDQGVFVSRLSYSLTQCHELRPKRVLDAHEATSPPRAVFEPLTEGSGNSWGDIRATLSGVCGIRPPHSCPSTRVWAFGAVGVGDFVGIPAGGSGLRCPGERCRMYGAEWGQWCFRLGQMEARGAPYT